LSPLLPPFPYTTLFRSWFFNRLCLPLYHTVPFHITTLRNDLLLALNAVLLLHESRISTRLTQHSREWAQLTLSSLIRGSLILLLDRKSTRLNSSHVKIS